MQVLRQIKTILRYVYLRTIQLYTLLVPDCVLMHVICLAHVEI